MDKRWKAVESRDARADGTFVYAVSSTKVYCRPSCPARRPRRENVLFFSGPAEAERAGFHACLRCRPADAAPGAGAVEAACRYLERHADEAPRAADVARASGMTPAALARAFRRLTGVTPRQYADELRARGFKRRLRAGDAVARATYDSGFGSSSRVYERDFGMTPATYGKGGRGARILWTAAACALGRVLVAATARGVCAVSLGEDDGELSAALRREFPSAEILRDDAALSRWTAEVVRRAAGAPPHIDLPLDVRATAFERAVWDTLRRIPHGATRAYGEVAHVLGRPGAARAVARACAANPAALIIPCHRVVRGDGTRAGYRWGAERKRALLEAEVKSAAALTTGRARANHPAGAAEHEGARHAGGRRQQPERDSPVEGRL